MAARTDRLCPLYRRKKLQLIVRMKSTGDVRCSRLSPLLLVLPFLDDLVLQCQQVLLVEVLGVVYKQIVPLVALVEDEIHNLEKCTANRQQTRVEL